MSDYIISTDLDGTLLDHYTYQWDSAIPSLERLKARGIPVIINTSKTSEEVIALQKDMDLIAPFIVENGSAIFFPKSLYPDAPETAQDSGDYWLVTLGRERQSIVEKLRELREKFSWGFEGFADMSIERVIELTGLNSSSAEQALRRKFSEPLVWLDSESNYQQFIMHVELLNLRVIKGGRFVHILGKTDKGQAISWCSHHLQRINGVPAKLIALGDSPNDIDMLNIADYAVLVNSPTHDYPETNTSGRLIKTKGFGPVGWHEAIAQIIQ
ncbi:HAD-IIB family hydrolase [Teredinibacter haidensis]|uniref:HAD-IIB family hydrolase n=1 Tax=Teredinibacter haidensis TaxID=2731755 RepID=UPI000948B6BB|nr:HAD-IIB family hydrolase [Teredinibacter haidensis]